MAWETRGNNQYYYRGRRVNGRVVKTYYGNGDDACKRSQFETQQKLRDLVIRQHINAEKESLDALDRDVAEQSDMAELVARLALVEKGFHLHQRGEWRKRR